MPKAARSTRAANRAKAGRATEMAIPRWAVIVIPIVLSLLIVVTLNVRAWTNASSEAVTNQQLAVEIDQLKAENAQLQEQIDRLQHDQKTIEREARKLGMGRVNEKVFVPTQ